MLTSYIGKQIGIDPNFSFRRDSIKVIHGFPALRIATLSALPENFNVIN